jgi:hypothetical protein
LKIKKEFQMGRVAAIVGIGLAICLIFVVFKLWAFIVGVAIITFVCAVVFGKVEVNVAVKPSPSPEKVKEMDVKASLDSLLKLNILARTTKGLSKDILEFIEQIVDCLVKVLPQANERYPNEGVTYELNRISKEHLFKSVKEYLEMSAASRENQRSNFKARLKDILDIVTQANDIIERNEESEFKTIANFLSTKYASV